MSEHTFPSTGTTRSDPMNSTFLRTAGALLLALAPALAFGDAPVPDKGDTSWMMISTVLVILMTIPGLALFYGGMVRSKNVLSVLMQVFMVFCLVTVLWVVFGYSLAFTTGNAFFGSLDKMFLNGVNAGTLAATFSKGVYIPEYVYVAFQGTFAAITPCLIVGAFAERMKFSAILLFVTFWLVLAYLPIAHMVWFWDGPDAYTDAEAAVVATSHAGYLFALGALDFAAAPWCTSTRALQVWSAAFWWASVSATAPRRWHRTTCRSS